MKNPFRSIWTLSGLLVALTAPGEDARLHAQAPDSTSSVRGWVVQHETGAPLVGAAVTLASAQEGLSATGSVVSGEAGFFGFPSVPPGLYRISVTLLGYSSSSDTVRVVGAADVEITFPLAVEPVDLEPVVVVVRRRPVGPLEGFERRRAMQRGVFLDRDEIDATNASEFTDLVRNIPGARLVPTATGSDLYFRGGCTPDLFLDGAHIGSTSNIDAFLRLEDLEAVEVYRGPEMPGEFGNNLCGAIVAWTLRGHVPGDEENDRSLRKQLIFAGSLVAAILGFRWIS